MMFVWWALGERAAACPVCSSPTGLAVRAGLLDGHFLRHFAVVTLPAPMLLLAVAAVHLGMPSLRERRG